MATPNNDARTVCTKLCDDLEKITTDKDIYPFPNLVEAAFESLLVSARNLQTLLSQQNQSRPYQKQQAITVDTLFGIPSKEPTNANNSYDIRQGPPTALSSTVSTHNLDRHDIPPDTHHSSLGDRNDTLGHNTKIDVTSILKNDDSKTPETNNNSNLSYVTDEMIVNESAALPKELIREGLVEKRGEKALAGWKKRYIQLFSNKTIEYYTDDKLKTKKGTCYLGSLTNAKVSINYKINFGFNIETQNRLWEFKVDSSTTRSQWVNTIDECIKAKLLTYNNKTTNLDTVDPIRESVSFLGQIDTDDGSHHSPLPPPVPDDVGGQNQSNKPPKLPPRPVKPPNLPPVPSDAKKT